MSVFQSTTVKVDRDTDGSFVLTLDVPNRSVNVITRQVLADLDGALTALSSQPRIPALVIRSGKKSGFLAGADLNEFIAIRDASAARAMSASGQDLFARLQSLPGPSVCVIHGPCLGGGLELALACDYRLVFDRAGTQLGLPEVRLGLLPGWGGTQRLPRIVGLERSLQVILNNRTLDARDALRWGLADALASTEAEFRDQYSRLLFRAVAQGKKPRAGLPLLGWRQKLLESNPIGRRIILRAAERLLRKKVPDDMPAPLEALDAVRVGLVQGPQAGFTQERESASRLALSPACRNLIRIFFDREAARRLPPNAPASKTVGLVGAGVMGAGIAQLAALSGHDVIVQEINQPALEAGLRRIDDLFAKAIEKRRIPAQEAQQRRAAIRGTVAWEGFDRVDLVIEAALEDAEVKRNLFRELDLRTPPTCVLATNTSSLTVSGLLGGLKHPERVAGLHFFNPVHKMPLVEVVRARGSSTDAIDRLLRFAVELGKTPVVVGDRPGFVVNRILMPYLNEALTLVGEGLKIADVDAVMRRFGMPAGPLELLDQIGLDIAAHAGAAAHAQLGEKYVPHAGFEAMRQKGWLGEKSGQGFYLHKGERSWVNAPAQELIRALGTPLTVTLPEAVRLSEARERMVLLMVNESATLLSEGVADAATIDRAMVFGTGWAPHRGGPLRYADERGLSDIVQSMESLSGRLGPRFAPCAELKKRVETGQRFRDEA